ncbi:MAG TPA: DUF4097 family beta strand repeat-containing protein [Candidatus Angelobacter sp.]
MRHIAFWFSQLTRGSVRKKDRSAAPMEQETCNWTGEMPRGATLKIMNVAGNIEVAGTSVREFRVTALKRGEAGDLPGISFDVSEQPGETIIRTIYSDRLPPSSDAHVHFMIEIPREGSFVGRTSNGQIKITEITDVEAVSSNGSIHIVDARSANAETRNGQIDVSIQAAQWDGSMQFRTQNGGIRVQLPPDASTEFRAETSNGWVSTEFPLKSVKRNSRQLVHGMIGGDAAGRQIICKTSNGSVHLARSQFVA